MRSAAVVLVTAVLASLAAACGSHNHDDGHEWTAEELAELERKWGMEVSKPLSFRLYLYTLWKIPRINFSLFLFLFGTTGVLYVCNVTQKKEWVWYFPRD